MRMILVAALLIAGGATSASAAASAGHIVNFYTPQQMANAKSLVAKAGRRVVATEDVQDGNFLFISVGDGLAYITTVTSSGQVYFGNGLPVGDVMPIARNVPTS